MKAPKTRKRKQPPQKIYFYCPHIVVLRVGQDEYDAVVVMQDLPREMRDLFTEWAALEGRPAYSEDYAYYNDFYDWFRAHSKDFSNA